MADPDPRPGGDKPVEEAEPTSRVPGTIKVGSVAGSDVLVTPSWFLIAALIAWLMAPQIDAVEPGLGWLRYVAGFAFAIVLYGAVLLHEAAHAIVAKRLGYPVGVIMLHFLGGATSVEKEAKRPRDEFWIAVVGPLVSLGVAAAAFGVSVVAFGTPFRTTSDGLIGLIVSGLWITNLFVGVLNLVPGLPLDGGRVFKAAVWGVTGNINRGNIVAGWAGRVLAVVVLLWPFIQGQILGVQPDLTDYVLAVIIGVFLWSGASAAIMSGRARMRLPLLVARDLARRTLAVPADLPLAEAVRRAQEAEAGSIVTVSSGGVPIGLVHEGALLATPEDRRPWMATSTVTRQLEDGLTLPADIDGESLVKAISKTPAPEYLLVEPDGSIYGVLVTSDVDAAFRAGA
ncbi:Zn-dependent protease (includes SpoIVFB) [Nocardioides sp. YR527]|uniref:site-2 protease family protein n=1 Tax=Nocardioides sp. YR527 TaxID=1881028 RepID=UPI0008865C70|nr:site-2 protease family protein [Nocardioides sp. YR527]SDJ77387.1 Zn-dependent protease (includes SpoIVFB) [Nocardioides sp. YR527]